MNRVSVIAVTALTLAGCATVAELRHKPPASTFTSPRGAEEVASCILSAWNAQRIGIEANGASQTRDGYSFLVVSPASGYPAEVAEVTPGDSGSMVAIHAQAALDVGGRTQKRTQAASACK